MEAERVTRNDGASEDFIDEQIDTLDLVETSDELKDFCGLTYSTINGNKYLCAHNAYAVSEMFPIIRNLRLRDDDVWAVGYPKSGNHWNLEVLTMILNQNTNFGKRAFRYHVTEYLGLGIQKLIDGYESPRILGSHIHNPENYPKEIFEKKLKIVYLIRNPKDVFVSHFNMWKSFKGQGLYFDASFSDYLKMQIKGEFIHGDWFDHVLTMEKFMAANPEHPVHVHSYEKMKEDPVSAIKELCIFLGKPTDLAADIARATEFGHMKKSLNAGKMKAIMEEFVDPSNERGFFRKGMIGDWRNVMTPEQSAQIDRVFNEKMGGSKLADLVREYI